MTRYFLFFSVALLAACNSKLRSDSEFEPHKFIYVSHTRLCTGVGEDKVDDRFTKVEWSSYDLSIHGGDVLCQTSKEPKRLMRACDTFNLLDSNSIWVKGNHDDDSLELLREFTNNYESFRVVKRGITAFIILDYFMMDNHFNSDYFLERLKKTDLQDIKHLIILTHYLHWTYNHPELEGLDLTVSNIEICEHSEWCLFPNDFMEKIYPVLNDLKQEGMLDVICLAGDAGNRRRTFHYQDNNGIDFIACGVNNASELDSVLIFQTTSDVMLDWEFKALNDLLIH